MKQLAREEIISCDQHEKLVVPDNLNDLTKIDDIVKETKAGQRLKFVPRTISSLDKKSKEETGNCLMYYEKQWQGLVYIIHRCLLSR